MHRDLHFLCNCVIALPKLDHLFKETHSVRFRALNGSGKSRGFDAKLISNLVCLKSTINIAYCLTDNSITRKTPEMNWENCQIAFTMQPFNWTIFVNYAHNVLPEICWLSSVNKCHIKTNNPTHFIHNVPVPHKHNTWMTRTYCDTWLISGGFLFDGLTQWINESMAEILLNEDKIKLIVEC